MGNFCCVDFQTNCKKSITIGYLKTLVNGVIPIHTEADPKFANDDYCPTYDELTNGILVAQYVDGGIDHWGDNVDGIIVEGSYSANSIVGKEDVIFCYTMFGEANLIVDKTEFDACGDSTYLIVTCGFVKVTRRLSSDCENIETTTYGGDTGLTKSFYSTENWLTFSGMTAEAGKNGTVSSSTRTTDVICTVENRGETYSSNTVTITQDGLTGAYESGGTEILDDFTARPSTTDTFGCEGGAFSVDGNADVRTRKNWIDECGVKYDDVYTESKRTEILHEENKFSEIECPTEEYRATSSLTISYSGVSSSFTFTQDCKQNCCRKTGYTCSPECRQEETITVDSCGDSGNFELDVESYCLDPLDREHTEPYYDYAVEWELLNGSGDLVKFSGRNDLTWTIKENCSHDALQNKATYARIIKPSGSSDVIQECIFNFIQESGRCETCPCDCGTLVLDPDDTEYYYTHMIGRDGGRFEYRYSSTPCSGNNRVEFVKRSSLDNWYTLEPTQRNGYIINVDRRSSSASATAYIDIYVNGVKCDKEIKFQQQAGCQCDDGIIDLMQSIPASGLPSGATIGTYQITNDCDNNITFTGKYINAENGVITLTKEIEPNILAERVDVNIIKMVSSNSYNLPVECERYVIHQETFNCDCDDLDISSVQIPQSGLPANSIIGTYSISSAECEMIVELSSSDLSINYGNGQIITTNAIPENDGENAITYSISGKVGTTSCGVTTLTQPGLECDCEDLTITLDNIPRSGLTANSQIGTYSITDVKCMDKITLSGSGNITINYSNGIIRTTNAIPENDGESAITYSVSGKIRTHDCKVVSTRQPGLECDCEDMTTSFSIPQSGIAANSQIGTYSFSNSDCLDKASFTSNDLNIAYNNGVITTINTIPANTDENAKSYTISGKVRTYDCTPIIVSQPGLACSCANITQFGSTIVEVPRSGYTASTKIGEYAINEDCEQFLTVSSTDGLVLTKSSGNIMVSSILNNDTPSAKTYTISASVRGGEPCASFTITQEAGCNCADDLISFNTNQVPNSGASTSFVIGTYTIGSDCSSAVAFSSDTLNITYANGEIHPQNEIPRNNNDESNEYAISAFVNSEYCETKIVSQPGLACDCEALPEGYDWLVDYFPYSGMTNQPIMSGESNGRCFENIVATINPDDEGAAQLTTTFENGVFSVLATIPGSDESVDYDIEFGIDDGTICFGTSLTKEPTPCSSIISSTTMPIAASGITDEVIATLKVSYNRYVREQDFSFSASSNELSINPIFNANNTIDLEGTVGAFRNDTAFGRVIYVNVIVKGVVCSTLRLFQNKFICECTDLVVTPSIATIPSAGLPINTQIATYEIDNEASGICLSAVSVTCESMSLNAINGSISLASRLPANAEASAITHTINVTSDSNVLTCTSITIVQEAAIVCDCSKALIVTKSIPSSGVPSGTSIAKIMATSPHNCGISDISLSGNNTTYDIRLSGLNPYSAITIDAIPANESEDINPFALSYNVGSAPCHVKIPQEGTNIKCDCSIISAQTITNKTIFPLSGSSGFVLIASADTKGCGTLEFLGNNTDEIFVGGSGLSAVTIDEYKVELYADIPSGDYKTTIVNIVFTDREGQQYAQCGDKIEIQRTPYYFDCNNVIEERFLGKDYVTHDSDVLDLRYISYNFEDSYHPYDICRISLQNLTALDFEEQAKLLRSKTIVKITINSDNDSITYITPSDGLPSADISRYSIHLTNADLIDATGTFTRTIPNTFCNNTPLSATVEVYIDGELCGAETTEIAQIGMPNNCCEAYVRSIFAINHSDLYLNTQAIMRDMCQNNAPTLYVNSSTIGYDDCISIPYAGIYIVDPGEYYYSILSGCPYDLSFEISSITINNVECKNQCSLSAEAGSSEYYLDSTLLYFGGVDVIVPKNLTSSERDIEGVITAYFNNPSQPCLYYRFTVLQETGAIDPYDYTDCSVVKGMITDENDNANMPTCYDLKRFDVFDCNSNTRGDTMSYSYFYKLTQSGADSLNYNSRNISKFKYTLEETDSSGNICGTSYTTIEGKYNYIDVYPNNQSGFCATHTPIAYSSVTCDNCDYELNIYEIHFKMTAIDTTAIGTGLGTTCNTISDYHVKTLYYQAIISKNCTVEEFTCNGSQFECSIAGAYIDVNSSEIYTGGTITAGTYTIAEDTSGQRSKYFLVAISSQSQTESIVSNIRTNYVSSSGDYGGATKSTYEIIIDFDSSYYNSHQYPPVNEYYESVDIGVHLIDPNSNSDFNCDINRTFYLHVPI